MRLFISILIKIGFVPCLFMAPVMVMCIFYAPLALLQGEFYIITSPELNAYVPTITCIIAGYGGACGFIAFVRMDSKWRNNIPLTITDIWLLWAGRVAVVTGMISAFEDYKMAHLFNSISLIASFIIEAAFRKKFSLKSEMA